MTFPRCVQPLLLLLLLATPAVAEEPRLTRAELARRGKAAVAFVLARSGQGRGTLQGTAFCVHPTGLFVTNAHVVGDATAIDLVLNPSLKDEKVFKATVLRKEEKVDLALLRAEAAAELPVLQLGDDRDLTELAEVVACGYPFGDALTLDKGTYPSITINPGSVASLRNRGRELELIQLDVSLNPGNSGGPVLDAGGRVIGVVLGGVRGTQVNFAIPVRRVAAFLAKPEMRFTAPALARSDRGKAVPVEVELINLLPGTRPPEVELVVRRGKADVTRHPMTLEKGIYRAKVVVLPEAGSAAACQIEAAFADGAVAGTVEDRAIRVGDASCKLSELRAVYPGRAGVLLRSGKRVEGRVIGLEAVVVSVGRQKLTVDLSAAEEVAVRDRDAGGVVVLEVVARSGGEEVGRVARTVSLDDAGKVYLADLEPSETRFGPWPLGKGTTGDSEGTPLSFGGKRYPKGLGLHANREQDPALVRYRLGGAATLFRTAVGYDDTNEGKVTGPTHFEVWGDGKRLWKSKAITTRGQSDECEVDVTGVEALELRVGVTGSGWGAHGVWLDPSLVGPDPDAIRRAGRKK
jgi:S1-C subfamily serine protease